MQCFEPWILTLRQNFYFFLNFRCNCNRNYYTKKRSFRFNCNISWHVIIAILCIMILNWSFYYNCNILLHSFESWLKISISIAMFCDLNLTLRQNFHFFLNFCCNCNITYFDTKMKFPFQLQLLLQLQYFMAYVLGLG